MENISLFKKVSLTDKSNFYEYLSVMLDGGVTISETLDTVQNRIKNPYFKEKIADLQTFVSSGDSFSKSMKKTPQIFSPGEISMIESGEATGKLSQSLGNLSENIRKNHDLQSKVKSAMTYPLIIFIFLFVAIIVVLVYVIPAVSQLFETSEVELPVATQALIATSNFVKYNWIVLVFLAAVGTLAFFAYKNSSK